MAEWIVKDNRLFQHRAKHGRLRHGDVPFEPRSQRDFSLYAELFPRHTEHEIDHIDVGLIEALTHHRRELFDVYSFVSNGVVVGCAAGSKKPGANGGTEDGSPFRKSCIHLGRCSLRTVPGNVLSEPKSAPPAAEPSATNTPTRSNCSSCMTAVTPAITAEPIAPITHRNKTGLTDTKHLLSRCIMCCSRQLRYLES